ncbi:unnamed protein product [Ambrosiozyma monospora]|uniref:Unnamed protein product n=2 Tax=Ambrosiozyma monospora TaxID=43982 RepID=A0ACB5UAA2_AMBMO|nr:unnamed protein product [Ambrosiozyma monospora]GMF05549.1 unnamed protein product [Ambrosiozyma monospora]
MEIDLDQESGVITEVGFKANTIPQFNVGYTQLKTDISKIVESEFGGKVSIGGMIDGIGVPDCVLNSFKAANNLSQ